MNLGKSIKQDRIQQRLVNLDAPVVFDKTEPAKSITGPIALIHRKQILFAWLRPPESHHSTVDYHDPACHRIENPNRFSVGYVAFQAR